MDKISDNKLEKNFINAWRPLYRCQSFIGSARVNIDNSIVVPRVWYQKVYSLVNLTLCCLSLLYLTSRSAFYELGDEWSVQSMLNYALSSTTLCLSGYPIIANNFFNIDANCNLFISLQLIDRALKITNEHHYKKIYWINVAYVVFLFHFHVVVDIFIITSNIGYSELYLAVPAILTLLAQDLEVVFFCGTIIFLVLRVRYMNSLLKRSLDARWKSLKRFETPKVISNIFDAYRHVIQVYVLMEKTTGLFLFLLCLHMFSNELLILEEFISQRTEINALTIFQSVILVTKVYNRILFTGIWVTRLEQQFINTRLACLRILSETTNKQFRRHAKNLLRLVTPVRPMTVLGMFPLKSLPLRLAALTATYAVVLLQFNFQSQTTATLQVQETTPSTAV